jgi:hypothetical protein
MVARRRGIGPFLVLAGSLLLPACAGFGDASYNVASTLANTGGRLGAPWGTMTPGLPETTATVERVVTGAPPGAATLQSEPGDVWPGPPPPRATLANPDAALRGIPEYDTPSRRNPVSELPGAPPPSAGPAARGVPSARRGSSTPPSLLDQPAPEAALPPRQPLFPPPAPPPAAPPPRADGQVIQTPSGPVVTTGGTDRVQSYVVPGGGAGTAVRQGNTTILIGPDGRVQSVPAPPR